MIFYGGSLVFFEPPIGFYSKAYYRVKATALSLKEEEGKAGGGYIFVPRPPKTDLVW
jgi:hypothetical protein